MQMSLVRLYYIKREDLKGRVVMRIIVDPVTKKLPHPRPKMVLSRINVLNPRAGPENAGMLLLRNLKTPLNTMSCCVGMMYARLYGYCSWLSKFSLCHPLLHLTRIPSQFSFLWVGNLVSIPNNPGMMLQLTLFKALVTRGYTH